MWHGTDLLLQLCVHVIDNWRSDRLDRFDDSSVIVIDASNVCYTLRVPVWCKSPIFLSKGRQGTRCKRSRGIDEPSTEKSSLEINKQPWRKWAYQTSFFTSRIHTFFFSSFHDYKGEPRQLFLYFFSFSLSYWSIRLHWSLDLSLMGQWKLKISIELIGRNASIPSV